MDNVECANGCHSFIPYNEGNMICVKCGRFAKVGYLEREKDITLPGTIKVDRINPGDVAIC